MENQQGHDEDQKIIDEELSKEVKVDSDIDPDIATPEQVKELITATKTLNAQKKHWRGKYEKTAIDPETGKPYKDLLAEAQSNESKKTETPLASETEEIKTKVSMLEQAEEKRQFGHQRGLSPEETDQVFSYAKGAGVKPTEALDMPFIKNAIDAMRREAKTGSATPGPSSRLPMVEGKRVSEMKKEDIKKNWTKITGAEK